MVQIGLRNVDDSQYPDLDLKAYMKCQSQAFTFSTLSFITGGGAGYVISHFLPKIYPKYSKKYNFVVMAGFGVMTSYLAAHFLTQQCQRKYFMSGPPASRGPPTERHSQKVTEGETIQELPAGVISSSEQKTIDNEVLFEQHKGVPKRV
ncbi:transmembrane protein 141-like [Amphiura filiformis]|uniref:transmembrane protein 141-like n=1 Tax=Amphiura filiformis TaxID=82378 RepID=UPI003B22458D